MRKISILPDRLFHKLWIGANSMEREEFVRHYSDKTIIKFEKYGIKQGDEYFLLLNLYDSANMSMKEILQSAGISKAAVSHMFCIPIRTLEDWYSGNNTPPSYIRLQLLRYFNLLKLNDYVDVESTLKYRNADTGEKICPKKRRRGSDRHYTTDISDPNFSLSSGSMDDIRDSINIRDILLKTDYISEILKRNSGN